MTRTEEPWLNYAWPVINCPRPVANGAKPWERLYLDMDVLTATR